MTTATEHCYIVVDDQILGGEPIIKATRTPVRAIVELWRLGVLPEEMPEDLPHLTLARCSMLLATTASTRTKSTSTSSETASPKN